MTRPEFTRLGPVCELDAPVPALPAPWVVVAGDTPEARGMLRRLVRNAERDAVIDGVLRACGVRS